MTQEKVGQEPLGPSRLESRGLKKWGRALIWDHPTYLYLTCWTVCTSVPRDYKVQDNFKDTLGFKAEGVYRSLKGL